MANNNRKSDIPVGTQFSPNLINLPQFLHAIVQHSGDKKAIQKAIFKPTVHLKRSSVPTSHRTASLPLEAAVQYGLLTPRSYEATEFAKSLEALNEAEIYTRFARHILLNLNGIRVLDAVQQMQSDLVSGLSDVQITGDSLAKYLSNNGLAVTEHNTAINTMRLWLSKAGIFKEENPWDIDKEKQQETLGISDLTLSSIYDLSTEQRAFLHALCKVNPDGWVKASDIRNLAEKAGESNLSFSRASLPKQVLEPLSKTSLIEWRSRGTKGGKTAELRTTACFKAQALEPFLKSSTASLDPVVTKYYRMRAVDIFNALNDTDTGVRGEALEAFAIHIMRLLGLRLIAWRKRARETAGAEIDSLMAGTVGGIATTWQVQCKNMPHSHISLDDIAKEIGVTAVTKATHILFVTNGTFTKDAREFAAKVMLSSSLSIYLLDKNAFDIIKSKPSRLGEILLAQSQNIVFNRLQHPSWS